MRDELRGRVLRLEEARTWHVDSALPSIALVHVESQADDVFEKAITNLLENGVECFCLSGYQASLLEDIVDEIIINGNYEKTGLFKRKTILTSAHTDEKCRDIALFIAIQVRLKKLNPIVYDVSFGALPEWKKLLYIV